jgi:outer membrane protein OmpA-like peptidoglycan-associated protein
MSLCQCKRFVFPAFGATIAILVVLIATTTALAQDETTPKADVFVGYQWLNPGGNLPIPGTTQSTSAPTAPRGFGGAIAYNFFRPLALEVDSGVDWGKNGLNVETLSTGPRLMWRSPETNFFIHALAGWNRMNSPQTGPSNRIGTILGAGVDLPVSKKITIRLLEADYQWVHQNFSTAAPGAPDDVRRPTWNGARLRSGIVFNIGGAPVIPPSASCSVQPSSVMVGEPITATATGSNFDPKHTLTYSWTATGGKVTGKDNTASIDTNGVAGGTYTVSAHIVDPKMKKGGEASCSASFTVKEPPKNPPTMSCSASPSSVQAGTASTITCTCTSPDNVPVNVAGWTSSGGSVSGSGNTATLNTTGASAGPITVSATCTDSRGLTASASSTVTVEVPPPPPPQASKLSECQFPNEKKPWRVDNTCKAVLDDVAQRLQHDPDAKLVIVGNAEPSEKRKNLAAERAVNSKAYLSGGEAKQGIDPSRIEVRTGGAGTKTAEYWVVPAGATFSSAGTEPVNESMVKAVPDHPAAPKKKAAKKAQ